MTAMTTDTRKTSRPMIAYRMPTLLALIALGACEAPPVTDLPAAEEVAAPEAAVAPTAQAAAQDLSATPTFIPFTDPPTLLNRQEVVDATLAGYPALLRDAGIGGTVRVHFFIDAEGIVRNAIVHESSGHPAIDRAALGVAEAYRFRPAMNGAERTPVWVSLPITFQPREAQA